ncbi:MAG: ral secretion pathway protein [Verrucomicrobiota bacterium]|nr:ral secretion pathway protein [Verrucomicrobiota bacterium]
MSTRTMLITLLAAAMTLPSVAQESTPPADSATPAGSSVAVMGSEPAANTVSRDRDTLSVDFPDEDIKTILRNVADLFELNLVVPDTLTGKTSIKLRDVTWRQIFKTVLEPVNYTYVEEGNIIKVTDNATLLQEPVATDVFIINNAKAEDLRPTVVGLVDAAVGGKVEVNQRSNALIITERPSRMGRIRLIIDQLDKATAQVMIESQFVEVTDRDIRNIGVNWAGLQNLQLGARQLSQTFERGRGQNFNNGNTSNASSSSNSSNSNNGNNSSGSTSGTTNSSTLGNNSTYITGLADASSGVPSSFNPATGAISGLPTSIPTITTNANYTPATVTTPASGDPLNTFNGISENGSTSSTTNSVSNTLSNTLANTASSAVNSLMGLTSTGGTSRLTSAVFSASDFNVIVSALKTQNNTKVVSNPTVVTLNNTEAVLNIGSEFPIPSYTYNSERGTFEVSGFQYKPIGIIMKVTPQVNAQGTIRLNLEPEVSQQNGETSFGGAGGATIPVIATRKVKTQISLQDGYTAGIGGLVTSNKNHGGTKVPVLGSIPGLGRLFSSKSVNDTTTNLLIFITAKTVNPDGAAPSDVFSAPALQSVGMDSVGSSNKN